MSDRGWKKGLIWTRKHLEKEVRLIEVRNFAKRKKAGLEDDIHDNDWGPNTDDSFEGLFDGVLWCVG